jgi:protoheme IX farnesyltransferase
LIVEPKIEIDAHPDDRLVVARDAAALVRAPAPTAAPDRGLLSDLSELTKLRLSSLVLVTTALGNLNAHGVLGTRFDAFGFTAALVGTALTAFGANVLNQWAERDLDAKMERTRNRPLPAGRRSPAFALAFGAALGVAGVAALLAFSTTLAALLAASSFLSYVLVYTPLKRITPHAALVGTVPGALPPVIGYVAAGGALDVHAAFLFAVLFFWQLPHFYAISWIYRADYARAGYPMLAVLDATGARLGRSSVFHLVALLVVSLLPSILGNAAFFYGAAAALFGGVFLWSGVEFARCRDEANARRLFVWSLLYLPALLLALVKDVL